MPHSQKDFLCAPQSKRYEAMKIILKRILIILSIIVLFFIGLTVIEIHWGSNSLHKWDVPISINVIDSETGINISKYQLFVSIFDSDKYREVRIRDGKYIMSMEYCTFEGPIEYLFSKNKITPVPSYYSFKILAPGYKDYHIEGKAGELREVDEKNKYEVLLPVITLEKNNS